MFTPASVKQITKAYSVNSEPLARKVDQDKKQNGGIPKDLRQLLALNDIANNRNAMGIQQALQAPTNMPTVAQSLQQQAQQAIQARMMQQAQSQQQKQGQPNVVPEGTPEPRMQPQGIDALNTNVGEGYADGGIIGNVRHFDGVTGSEVKDNRSLIERLLYSNLTPAEQARKEALEARAEANRKTPTKINEERARNMAEVNKPDANKTQETFERLGLVTRQEQPVQQVIGQTTPKAETPPAPPRANPVTQTRVNAEEKPGITAALPAAPTAAYTKLTEMMNQDPEAKAKALRDRYLKEVGERDLSIYDKTAAELQARKEKLNAPKQGYDALMDYLENIAEAGGKDWQTAGAGGARLRKKKQLEREAEQNALMDKILELGAKKADAQYAEKKGMFDLTEKERDDIFKQAFDAAKSVNASDDEAKKLAQQAVENEKNRQAQIRSAQIGAQDRDQLMNRAKALMAVDKTLSLSEAMQKAATIAATGQLGAAEMRANTTADQTRAKIREKYAWVDMLPPNDPTGIAMRKERDRALAAVGSGAGLPDALTSAGGPTSSNVRSQADAIISGGR